jgi:hypothetical protein
MKTNSLFSGWHWLPCTDGDPRAYALAMRHYTANPYRDGRRRDPSNPSRRLFVGPGEKMVLLTGDCQALFVWRKFIDGGGQRGVNCALFRNEGLWLSSTLILEAEDLAWARWPGERLYTYVNPRKVRSANPGYCFKAAGWRLCGVTKSRRLLILEKLPTAPTEL